ncbi:MAG: hypothetical protein EAY70_05535 [Sphingomonadales bacterium]|nr:MAG: hypothetical protein EAY70_05535 [Sphingomonadales bacterium]
MNFDSFMVNAPKILFNLGWVLAALTFMAGVMAASMMPSGQAFMPSLFIALSSAVWAVLAPWIAAAVIWRMDKYLEARK